MLSAIAVSLGDNVGSPTVQSECATCNLRIVSPLSVPVCTAAAVVQAKQGKPEVRLTKQTHEPSHNGIHPRFSAISDRSRSLHRQSKTLNRFET